MNIAVTGGTGFIGKRVIPFLVNDMNVKKIFILCRRSSIKKIRKVVKGGKITHIECDLSRSFAGINQRDRKKLRKVEHFIHLGAVYDIKVDRETAYKVNVKGTEEILKIAEDCEDLRSFTHISTIAICGDYRGIFTEDMFDEGQKFGDWYGWSKFEAERIVREHLPYMPVKIIRPGVVIGETQTGKMDKIDGVYYIILLLSLGIHIISPTVKYKTLPIIPVDFLAEFIYRAALSPETVGKTFFAIEPSPPTFDEFMDIVCKELKTFSPILKFDIKKLEPVLKSAPVNKLMSIAGKIVGIPYEEIHYLLYDTIYNTRNFSETIIKFKMKVPSFKDYAKNIIKYFLENLLPTHPLYRIYKLKEKIPSLLR